MALCLFWRNIDSIEQSFIVIEYSWVYNVFSLFMSWSCVAEMLATTKLLKFEVNCLYV